MTRVKLVLQALEPKATLVPKVNKVMPVQMELVQKDKKEKLVREEAVAVAVELTF